MQQALPPNPFVSSVKLNNLQKIQVVLMSLTLAPLKLIAGFLVLLCTWLLGIFFTIGVSATSEKPATPFRRFLFTILQKMGRLVLFIWGLYHIKVTGKRAKYSEAPILAIATHTSFLDGVLWFISSPLPSVLSKFENSKLPIFGTLIKALQPIFVKRDDPKSRENTKHALQQRINTPGDWPQIIIFPEGTCTNGQYMMRLKGGAFLTGAPVQPVTIRYTNSLNTSSWTECSPHAFKLFWLCICQFRIKCEVNYMPVYKPNQEEIDNPRLYGDNVRIVLGTNLGLPFTDHCYEDRMLVRHAIKLKFPPHIGSIEFYNVRSKIKSLDFTKVKDMLTEYVKIANKGTGFCTIEDFSKYLQIPVNSAMKDLFSIYNKAHKRVITFRDYIFGYHHISSEINKPENVKKCFQIFSIAKHHKQQSDLNAIFTTINSEISEDKNDLETEFKDFITKQPNYGILLLFFDDVIEQNDDPADSVSNGSRMQLRKRNK